MSIKYNVIIQKEEEWYVAKCIDNNVASQGKTVEEALKNLKEAVELALDQYKKIIIDKNRSNNSFIIRVEDYNRKNMNNDIIKKLKKSEEEIEKGEGIDSDEAFEELRQKYGY